MNRKPFNHDEHIREGWQAVAFFGVLTILVLALVLPACDNVNLFGSPTQISTDSPVPTPTPKATPTPVPTATPTATPIDPCGGPVTAVRVSGEQTVKIGSIIGFDVTPVSSVGPLEGALDYCNAHRFPTVEHASTNLRCVGSCGGWKPQFLAVALGPFEVQIRVDGAVSPTFAGTVGQ